MNTLAQIEKYTSPENNFYWKNQLPFAGYWQQDVYYKIKATVDDKTDIISGTEILEYKNNSPDTIKELFFHLYQNAFTKNSYLSELTKNNNEKIRYGKYENENLGITIDDLKIISINGEIIQASAKTEIDNTILKITLPQGLLPNSTVSLSMSFKSYYSIGSQRRRMKMYYSYGVKHYNGCQWYPKLAVYDRKFGWSTDQHLGREFYGNFGNFDVELSFPNNYIVEATGILQNENEVLPDDLKNKLDIKNFANKPWEEMPSEIIKPDGTTKTWKYYAENVHDFAFTADPTYRIGVVTYKNVKCVAVVQEPHAAGWQNAATYAARIIDVFSKDFGEFAYPKIVVADARDGMEYPMITMDGGRDPSYRGLFVHEIGHNWFYAMVGNNETYRAMMDEGFTQFLTAWGLEKLEGDRLAVPGNASTKQKLLFEPFTQKYASVYSTYLNAAMRDKDGFINTHSDQFGGALGHGGGYGMVYRKTGAMLYNLQYVLGEDLFFSCH
ncbi:MAG: M1 family metallopeptidase [Bacteroidetes bacterium]|nr:M1 family metallopeptidase [Bacteroidota bacterium]